MASKQVAVSLTPEEIAFVEEKDLSPTGLLKEKIHEIQALNVHSEKFLKEEIRKREAWQETSNKQRDFIERKGLMDEYLKENGI